LGNAEFSNPTFTKVMDAGSLTEWLRMPKDQRRAARWACGDSAMPPIFNMQNPTVHLSSLKQQFLNQGLAKLQMTSSAHTLPGVHQPV
jgi:hypothetical protein